MTQIRSLTSQVIDSPPSCAAFCPTSPQHLVIGTYVLHKQEQEQDDTASQRRTGQLKLYELMSTDLHTRQELPLLSAVLDIEWSPHSAGLLAVATSTGTLELYNLRDKLHHQATFRIGEETDLVLDLAWHPAEPHTIGLTLSGGKVLLCRATDWADTSFTLQHVCDHTLEPWTLAFSADGSNIFSGGDDMLLQCRDITADTTIGVWQDSKLHSAGITAILPLTEDLVVTGSYDDHIRLLHRPRGKRPTVLAETDLEGGVWRLKLVEETVEAPKSQEANKEAVPAETESYTILASCMHAGTRIVKLVKQSNQVKDQAEPDITWSFAVLARFEEHKSMNYGSDASTSTDGMLTVVSTSFYDRLVCVWQYDMH